MRRLLSKIIDAWRREGIGGVARRAARFHRRRMIFFDRPLDQPDTVPFLPRHPFVVRFLGESDLSLIAPHVSPERLATHRERLRQGHRVIGILTPGEAECLGWVWCIEKGYYEPYDNVTYVAVPGSLMHVDGEVIGGQRGRGLAFTVFPLIWRHWRQRGFRQCHCVVTADNKPSIKFHGRVGYRPAEQFTVTTLLAFKWARPAGPRHVPGRRS